MERRYGYFDHDADIGIVGHGDTVEAAFIAAAEAVFAIMVDLPAVRPRRRVNVEFDEPDVELALVTWLNDLLAAARGAGLVLGRFQLRREGTTWHGEAWGEGWHDGMERGTEVKGATLTMLSVEEANGAWEARCVVDV